MKTGNCVEFSELYCLIWGTLRNLVYVLPDFSVFLIVNICTKNTIISQILNRN